MGFPEGQLLESPPTCFRYACNGLKGPRVSAVFVNPAAAQRRCPELLVCLLWPPGQRGHMTGHTPGHAQVAKLPRLCALGTSAQQGHLPKMHTLLSQENLDYFAAWMEMHFEY